MKVFISIIILLTLNACAKEEKYLSEPEVLKYYHQGQTLKCLDKNDDLITVTKNQFEANKLATIIFTKYLPKTRSFFSVPATRCIN